MNSKKNFLLTGATGLLGRNLVFEIIKSNISHISNINIFILGRHDSENDLSTRMMKILEEDGIHYLGLSKGHFEEIRGTLSSIIHCIDFELEGNGDLLSHADETRIKSVDIDYFFHIAASTDFRDTDSTRKHLWSVNVDGTKRVIKLAEKLSVKNFIYTGSAYCCGLVTGQIAPDYINQDKGFRNPYEQSKLEAEIAVKSFSDKNPHIQCKFFRPTTISGRLLEGKIGAINKFDVFYAWMFFFLRRRYKMFSVSDIKVPVEVNCRIAFNSNSGLNIVPADYAAKAMYTLSLKDTSENSFHLANEQETPHAHYLSIMLNAINITGYEFVSVPPTNDLSQLEALYYDTVGVIYSPYILSEPMNFRTPPDELLPGLQCPKVEGENFEKLVRYALQQ